MGRPSSTQPRAPPLSLSHFHSPSFSQSLEGQVAAAAGEADRLGDAAAHAAGVLVPSLEAEVERRE